MSTGLICARCSGDQHQTVGSEEEQGTYESSHGAALRFTTVARTVAHLYLILNTFFDGPND